MSLELRNVDHLYDKDQQLKKEEVVALSHWIKTQPELPELTELQLILFYHSCRYDTELAKTTIINYCNLKTNSEIIRCANEETIRSVLTKFLTLILPKQTPDGDVILFWKVLDSRPEIFDCAKVAQLFYMATILHFHHSGPANGFVIIFDTGAASIGHLLRMSITAIRQVMFFLQEAAPMRLKAMHFVNMSPVTKHLIAFARPFMKKEVYEAIRLHTGPIDTLYEFVPRDCLPKELGGDLPSFCQMNDENIENIVNNSDFFEWHDTQKVDESKRIDKGGGFFGTVRGFFG